MLALVGAGCDERVGDGVDDVTDGLDQPDNRENPQYDPPLRDEIGDSRFFGRLIKIDEVVVEHGRKQTHGKLRQAQSYDQRHIYFFMSPRNLLVRLDVSQRADVIALRNGLGQLEACVKAAADAVVAAHGDVAQSGDLLVAAAGFLPGLDQRAVVEIEIERVVRILDEVHLEHPSGRAGEQRLSQTLEALGAALFLQVGALRNAASRDSRRGKLLRIQTALFGLIHQQIQPECAVLQQLADPDDEFVLDSRLVDDLGHDFFLLLCFITICTRFCALAPSVSHFQMLVHAEHENRSFFDENRRKPGAQRISERPGVWFCGRGCARCVFLASIMALISVYSNRTWVYSLFDITAPPDAVLFSYIRGCFSIVRFYWSCSESSPDINLLLNRFVYHQSKFVLCDYISGSYLPSYSRRYVFRNR